MTRTLLDHLRDHARSTPEREALVYENEALSFADLERGSSEVASALLDRGLVKGDRVVLVHPNGPGFYRAFFGVQRAGGAAVPIFPGSGPERVAQIARLCGARAIMPSTLLPDTRQEELRTLDQSPGPFVITDADCAGRPIRSDLPHPEGGALAYIQYTSGSTGNPKGVMLSHDNLVTNIRQMMAGFEITETDVFVSWLPVSHDLGLILMTLTPILMAAPLVLMETSIQSIRRWLEVIAARRGTFTAAPDFAYRIAMATAKDPASLDLSSLRVAVNAAEPVRSSTIRDFEKEFSLDSTITPAYGLAEATVGVAGRRPGTEIKTDERGLVSVGRPFPGVEVEIIDGEELQPAFTVGEIAVRGPATTRGYLGNPEATAALHTARGSVRTGDLGYLDDEGELFIVGRRKAIIIQAGRNVAPQEIEEIVDHLGFVRRSAAVGIDRGGREGEQAWVFVEINDTDERSRFPDMVVEVVRVIHRHLGMRPGRVCLLRPRTIPTTHNGKIRHDRLRRATLEGELRASNGIIYPDH